MTASNPASEARLSLAFIRAFARRESRTHRPVESRNPALKPLAAKPFGLGPKSRTAACAPFNSVWQSPLTLSQYYCWAS